MNDITEDEPVKRTWRWLPDQSPPSAERAALHRFAAAVRRIAEGIVDAELTEDELAAAAEAAERFAERLEASPRGRALRGFAESANAGRTEFEFDSSPIMGRANPIAPPLVAEVRDGVVEGTATFGRQYEGPPGHVHGGFVAATFDEILGIAMSLSGKPAMTGRLVTHYRSPTPLYQELRFRARLERVDGRKVFTSATLHAGETLCAEAEGLFIVVDFSRFLER